MAERRRIVPTIANGNPFLSHNIVSELAKAWDSADQMEPEFPFEVKTRYQDVTGIRKFESTVKMAYCPIAENTARQQALATVVPRIEHKIIKKVKAGNIGGLGGVLFIYGGASSLLKAIHRG